MKRITALILTCLLSVGLLCGCGAQQPEPALPEIIIGSDTYPPYVYLDDNGDPTGIDVEIATEAFRRMGYQAVFTTIDWEQKKTLVDSGEVDRLDVSQIGHSLRGQQAQQQAQRQ